MIIVKIHLLRRKFNILYTRLHIYYSEGAYPQKLKLFIKLFGYISPCIQPGLSLLIFLLILPNYTKLYILPLLLLMFGNFLVFRRSTFLVSEVQRNSPLLRCPRKSLLETYFEISHFSQVFSPILSVDNASLARPE